MLPAWRRTSRNNPTLTADPRMLKKLIALLCLVGSALALYNVYSEIAPLQKQAELVACPSAGCAQLIGMQRSPVSVLFRFQVERNRSTTVEVSCARALILLGDYSCSKQ